MIFDLAKVDADIRRNLYNPQNMWRDGLIAMQAASDNTLVPVDHATPFANLLMYISTQSAINNDQVDRIPRRLIPEYASTIDELSGHFDYTTLQTIFATPSSTIVNLVIPTVELTESAIKNSDGSSHLILPRDSVFTYTDGTKFGLHHDIMIRIIDEDTMDIYYMDNTNKLMRIEEPIITYEKRTRVDSEFHNTDLTIIPIKVYQFSKRSEYRSVTAVSGLDEKFALTDQLYHASVTTRVGGKRVELLTAHGDFKYNPNSDVATAILSYGSDNTIRIRIPDVYIDKGMVGNEVAITLYETKGNIDVNMLSDGTFNFVPDFINTIPTIDDGVNALRKVTNLGAYSGINPSGGLNMPTLQELINRVIVGNTDNAALTEEQLRGSLEEMGYSLSHQLNYIGRNMFTASNKLSDYSTGDVPTLVGSSNLMAVANELTDKAGVIIPKTNKAIITPYAVLEQGEIGNARFLTYDQVAILNVLDDNALLNRVNNSELASPIFYYLLDTTTETPKYGAFDLDNPAITNPVYIGSNVNNLVKVSTNKINITKKNGSYFVDIVTRGNDSFRDMANNDVILQLTTKDDFGSVFSINAVMLDRTKDGEYLFRAELQTGFNVGLDDTMEILNFKNSIYESYNLPLSSQFMINYVVTNNKYISNDRLLEDDINRDELPTVFSVVTTEKVTLTIGTMLNYLFTPINSSLGHTIFQQYTSDVYKYWEHDVYEEENGLRKFYVNPDYNPDLPTSPENPSLVFNKLISKGDKVLEEDGSHAILHAEGTIIRDDNDEPIPVSRGDFNHLISLQTIDYKFSLINYLSKAQYEIKANINRDIVPISLKMIKDVYLNYSLGNTMGDMEILIDGKTTKTISNEISMSITVKVNSITYKDGTLRKNITKRIKTAVAKHLTTGAYIENGLIDEINDEIRASVISFKIDSISSLGDIQSFHLVNGTDSMGIKSILSLSSTGEFEILDGIEVNFISQ